MSSDQTETGKEWEIFITTQLSEFADQTKEIIDLVLQNDEQKEKKWGIPTKKKIINTIANLNERVFDSQDLYFQMNNPKYALQVYFMWFKSCMKGQYRNAHRHALARAFRIRMS